MKDSHAPLLIGISGPPGGGKSTLAREIELWALAHPGYIWAKKRNMSDSLREAFPIASPPREYLIELGELLRKYDPEVLCSISLGFLAGNHIRILAGIKDQEEWLMLQRIALRYDPAMRFLLIHQSTHASKEAQRTPPGEPYPGDIRVNMMDVADLWNPQKEIWVKKILEYFPE